MAWNHVDLRIAADFPFRIKVALTATELVLRARSMHAAPPAGRRVLLATVAAVLASAPGAEERAVARGCLSCDQTRCFRHRPEPQRLVGRTAVVLNDPQPELARHWAGRLQPEHTDLVLSQDLLVPLWRLGVLAGRSVVVHLHQLPAAVLQARLDAAAALHPGADCHGT